MKMLLTWRATVFSLIPSASAIARLVLPVATRRSTSISRAVRTPLERRVAAPDAAVDPGEIGRRAELRRTSARPRRAPSRAVSSSPSARCAAASKLARARRLVRRVELVPRCQAPREEVRAPPRASPSARRRRPTHAPPRARRKGTGKIRRDLHGAHPPPRAPRICRSPRA